MYETGYSPGIILDAFSGSMICVISATEFTLWENILLFFLLNQRRDFFRKMCSYINKSGANSLCRFTYTDS